MGLEAGRPSGGPVSAGVAVASPLPGGASVACLQELDGFDLLGHGFFLQKPLFILLLRGDTREGQATGQTGRGQAEAMLESRPS